MAESLNNTQIDFIPGMPPDPAYDDGIQDRTKLVMENSMPIAQIYPGIPSFTKGLSLFTREPLFSGGENQKYLSYTALLKDHGFSLSPLFHRDHLTVAYIADSFPTDSFTNEYGENFLQSLTDVASTSAASLAQMAGVRTAGEAISRITGVKSVEDALKNMKGQGGMKGTAAEGLQIARQKAGEFLGRNTLGSLLAGGRIDFPMVWKSSAFQPSYTMTIRLYNPNPGDERTTKKYIGGPIAALLLLGLPISPDNSGNTYSWPFIHRIWSPGIYDLDPAFISNITVIKGGDQQQIAHSQRLGIVDVRIDFGSLFNSMLASKKNITTRPTLKKYLNGIYHQDSSKVVFETTELGRTPQEILANNEKQNKLLSKNPAAQLGSKIINVAFQTGKKALTNASKSAINQISTSIKNKQLPNLEAIKNSTLNTGVAAAKSLPQKAKDLTDEELRSPTDRVSQQAKDIADDLLKKFPSGL